MRQGQQRGGRAIDSFGPLWAKRVKDELAVPCVHQLLGLHVVGVECGFEQTAIDALHLQRREHELRQFGNGPDGAKIGVHRHAKADAPVRSVEAVDENGTEAVVGALMDDKLVVPRGAGERAQAHQAAHESLAAVVEAVQHEPRRVVGQRPAAIDGLIGAREVLEEGHHLRHGTHGPGRESGEHQSRALHDAPVIAPAHGVRTRCAFAITTARRRRRGGCVNIPLSERAVRHPERREEGIRQFVNAPARVCL